MKQYEIDCFEVREADGGGVSDNHVAYVTTMGLAEALVSQSKGWRKYYPYKKLITIFDTLEEIEANSTKNLRKSGLAKLTAAEAQALGLK